MTADEWSVVAFGDDAVLVTLPDLTAVRAVDGALRSARRAGGLAVVVDQVPAAASVLLRAAPGVDLEGLVRDVRDVVAALAVRGGVDAEPASTRTGATSASVAAATEPEGPHAGPGHASEPARAPSATDTAASGLVTLPVRYDGPDLDEVAGLTGLTRDEVVRRHAGTEYTVAFGGFMPGFAYLVGLDRALHVPRRESPRERVPAGAVAIADHFSAVYPAATPGGWRLLGTCDVALFDVDRDPPALLTPGTRVRFRPVPAADPAGPERAGPGRAEPEPTHPLPTEPEPAITVLDPGTLTLVEDLGRTGWAHVGVGRAGAADGEALALANRLVGNPEGAAGLEVLLGGLRVRAERPVTVALAGAPGPADVDGHPVGRNAPIELAAGQVLHVGTASRGLRVYLAVRGGVDVAPVLGSRSADQLAGLGPAPLAAGDALPVGPAPADLPPVDVAPVRDWAADVVLRVTPGPHAAWVERGPEVLDRSGPWLVTPATNRVALRLDGTPLRRVAAREHAELPPAALVPGAVQVPPDGRPIVFGVDHPVTGGYPVLAVVRRPDLHWLAQLRPGERVRFVVR